MKARLLSAAWLLTKPQAAQLIISAGMPRSGSTLLFNILRDGLQTKHGDALASGWIGDVTTLPKTDAYLIKSHNITPLMRWRADAIFYTYRDIRTVLVSRLRKFGHAPTMPAVDGMIEQYNIAKQHATLSIKYETLMANKAATVEQLMSLCDVSADAAAILARVDSIRPPKSAEQAAKSYSKESLLHPDHMTGTQPDDWQAALDPAFVAQVVQKHRWWFDECGYSV